MASQGTRPKAASRTTPPPIQLTANPQQIAAIAHSHGPAAFVAAAGTGKTTILVQRLVRLIADERVAPETILCVTFTRAAADEMEKRALKALKGRGFAAKDVKGLRVVTFHGLGHHMLREKLEWTPQELNQRLVSGEPRQWLAEDILRPWRSDRSRGMNWDVEIADVLSAVDRAKEGMVKPEQAADFFRSHLCVEMDLAERYQEFFVRYEQTKHKEKLYDLSDLIYVPLSLLESSPKFRKTWHGVRTHQEYLASRTSSVPQKWDDVFTPIHCGEQNMAFRTVANIPSREYFARTTKTSHRFTPTFFCTLMAHSGGRPLLQYCEEHSYTVAAEFQLGIKDFVALIQRVYKQCNNHPVQAITLLRQFAYDLHLRYCDGKHSESEEETETSAPKEEAKLEGRYDELEELTQIAQRHHTIRHFLTAMARLKEQAEESSKNKRDCVNLMTIHKAKGLESQVVFVMGLTEGIFPHRRSYTLAEDGPVVQTGIAEERRLAYVAFTRAQKHLFLSSILRYRGSDAVASRFIEEAGLVPTDEDGVLNPYLFHPDGSIRQLSPLVTTPTLFE